MHVLWDRRQSHLKGAVGMGSTLTTLAVRPSGLSARDTADSTWAGMDEVDRALGVGLSRDVGGR